MQNVDGVHLELFPAFESAERAYHPGTAQHSARASRLAETIGRALGLELTELETVTWAGMLHDVGKLAVPTDILRKPGPLDASEWAAMRRHPIVGADMLLAISPELAAVAEAVRSHHERWDGTGYPEGLGGEDIPLAGRIIAVADAYDALTQPRVYRPRAFSHDDALDLLYASAGSQFDPRVIGALLSARQHPVSAMPAEEPSAPPHVELGAPLSIGINGRAIPAVEPAATNGHRHGQVNGTANGTAHADGAGQADRAGQADGAGHAHGAGHGDVTTPVGPHPAGSGLSSQARTAIPALRILRVTNLLENPDADL